MNNIEKSLAEKVLFSIHIDDNINVIKFYDKFREHRRMLRMKDNDGELGRVNEAYAKYMVKKHKGDKVDGSVRDAYHMGWLI